MNADENGKVTVRMKASVGTLRAFSIQHITADRAQRLIEKNLAALIENPSNDQPKQEDTPAEQENTDAAKSPPRTRRSARNRNGRSDPARRLDQPDGGEPGQGDSAG